MSNAINILSRNREFAVKGKQYIMEYDTDFPDRTTLIRQRLFFTPGTPEVFTPLTPTIETRIRPLEKGCPVPTSLPFDPRKVTACFDNPNNEQKFSEYSVFIPFRPNDDRLNQSLREIINLDGVGAVKYDGETHNNDVRNYVN